jgi:hypothetical protein
VIDLLKLFLEQQASGFPDVAGARASVTLPVSDRLVTRLAAQSLPPSAPISEIDLRAGNANRLSVRVRLTRPALLPPITVNLAIDRQPVLPSNPVLILRLLSTGLLSFAGAAARFFNVLPPGIRMDGELIFIDLRTLLEQRGLGAHLNYLEHLEVTTEEGRFIVSVRGRVPPRAG